MTSSNHNSGPLLVPAHDWKESFTPNADRAVWNSHRPLYGDTMWEGKSRYGTWYAVGPRDHHMFDKWVRLNADLDAREIVLVTNAELVGMFDKTMAERGMRYTLHDYLAAGCSVAEAMSTVELPWHPEDHTADQLIAELTN